MKVLLHRLHRHAGKGGRLGEIRLLLFGELDVVEFAHLLQCFPLVGRAVEVQEDMPLRIDQDRHEVVVGNFRFDHGSRSDDLYRFERNEIGRQHEEGEQEHRNVAHRCHVDERVLLACFNFCHYLLI